MAVPMPSRCLSIGTPRFKHRKLEWPCGKRSHTAIPMPFISLSLRSALFAPLVVAWRKEQLHPRSYLFSWCRWGSYATFARSAPTCRAAHKRISYNAGKQATAVGTGVPVEAFGEMILPVCIAPQCDTLASLTQVNRVFCGAMRHRSPAPVAYPTEIVTQIARRNQGIFSFVLIAHIRLRMVAHHCASGQQ